jgi:7-cyano-7-deazaguanine synthase
MKSKKKIVVTVSGGMDSAVLLYMAIKKVGRENVFPLFFNYDQRHIRELDYARTLIAGSLGKNLKEVDVKFIRELAPVSSLTNNDIATPKVDEVMGEAQPKSYVPFRNLMFLSICSSYAESVGAEEIWYGATQIDSLAGYWDAEENFVKRVNQLIKLNREKKIKVVAPLINMNKADIVLKGVELKVPFEQTYTCYSGDLPADATSASSSLRIKGFLMAGYVDPMPYKQDLTETWKKHNCRVIYNDATDTTE